MEIIEVVDGGTPQIIARVEASGFRYDASREYIRADDLPVDVYIKDDGRPEITYRDMSLTATRHHLNQGNALQTTIGNVTFTLYIVCTGEYAGLYACDTERPGFYPKLLGAGATWQEIEYLLPPHAKSATDWQELVTYKGTLQQ